MSTSGFLRRLPTAAPAAAPRFRTVFVEAAPTAPVLPLDQAEIPTVEAFTALSTPAGDLVANGRVAKFLVDLRSSPPQVHFVNGNFTEDGQVPDAAKYHYFFAQRALGIPESSGTFNQVTYFTAPKTRYAAGVIHTYFLDGAAEPVYGLQFYPQDVVREREIVNVVERVKEKIGIPGARFAFVQTGSQQTTATVGADLAAAGIESLTLDRVLGSILYLPLNAGEAWGYLASSPSATTPHPDGHPGLRRAPPRPLGRRRRDHQGRAGQQLARQPEVQGAGHAQHGAARRRAGPSAPRTLARQARPFRGGRRRLPARGLDRRGSRQTPGRAQRQAAGSPSSGTRDAPAFL